MHSSRMQGAAAAHELMESLADASFPDNHSSLARVVNVLNDLEVRTRKWCESSPWVKRLALTRMGITKACKYRDIFQQLFALLDRALDELVSAVVVDSYGNLGKLRVECSEAAALSRAEVLQALGDQDASLEELLEASRAQADALADMETRLDCALGSLKEDLVEGKEAAQAAAKAAAAVAKAMEKLGSGDGRGAEDMTGEIIAAFEEQIAGEFIPALGKMVEEQGERTRAEVAEVGDKVENLKAMVQDENKKLLEYLQLVVGEQQNAKKKRQSVGAKVDKAATKKLYSAAGEGDCKVLSACIEENANVNAKFDSDGALLPQGAKNVS